jgi:hypothetical protein
MTTEPIDVITVGLGAAAAQIAEFWVGGRALDRAAELLALQADRPDFDSS